MKKLNIFIKGETIDLCKPTLEFARKSHWYSWFNDPKIIKYLRNKYKNYKNTPKKQEKFFLSERKKRLFLIISTKNKLYKGVISLSNINKNKHTCDIAIVTDTEIESENAPYAALEAIAKVTQYAFEKMNIKKICGTGNIKLGNWQQRMELFGYRINSLIKNVFLNGKRGDDEFVISCAYSDYLLIIKKRKKLWDSLKKMKKRINKLPKVGFRDKLTNFLDKDGSKYYEKIFNL